MWLTGRLIPDHKTIADFRKDNGPAIRKVCAQFIALCREMGLLTSTSVAIDGSKFKAVNTRDKNFTRAKMERRLAQIEESVPARHRRPAGAVGGAGRQNCALEGEACQAGERAGALEGDRFSKLIISMSLPIATTSTAPRFWFATKPALQ
jgi:hypothetical protein